jgi:hypothetical protein
MDGGTWERLPIGLLTESIAPTRESARGDWSSIRDLLERRLPGGKNPEDGAYGLDLVLHFVVMVERRRCITPQAASIFRLKSYTGV